MLVSHDNKIWDKRVVVMAKCGGFVVWKYAQTLEEAEKETGTMYWKYAKKLKTKKKKQEEIAKWKGTTKEQIIIK